MTFRDIQNIDIKKFRSDISSSNLYIDPDGDLAKRVEQYNAVLQDFLDAYALLVTRSVTLHPNAPWFNEELRESKRLNRRCEREIIKPGLEVDRIAFHEQFKAYRCDLEKAKLTNTVHRFLNATTRICSVLLIA